MSRNLRVQSSFLSTLSTVRESTKLAILGIFVIFESISTTIATGFHLTALTWDLSFCNCEYFIIEFEIKLLNSIASNINKELLVLLFDTNFSFLYYLFRKYTIFTFTISTFIRDNNMIFIRN